MSTTREKVAEAMEVRGEVAEVGNSSKELMEVGYNSKNATKTSRKVPEAALKETSKARSKKKPAGKNKEIGNRGELAASRFLERQGYEIVERNWVCPAGEADLIVKDEDTLVFVEVKTRTNTEKGLPEEAVTAAKRRRYEKIAVSYLQDYESCDIAVRFDVISILVVANDRAFLRHHINAFGTEN